MDWHALGHAAWLVEAGEVRLLFDPALSRALHGGVFEVAGRGEVDLAALRPDFVLVSHRHPDHFDVPTLAALARLDADAVVLTPDPLVERAARALGFRAVARLAADSVVDLAGARVVTTPSRSAEPEWGAVVEGAEGTAWNQVDSVLAGPEGVRAVRAGVARGLGRGSDEAGFAPSLVLARWQPALEVEAVLAGRVGFPLRAYTEALDAIAATGARAVVTSSAGVRHAGACAWMNRYVYPVPEARAVRDIAARTPGVRAMPLVVGATYRVRGGETECARGGASRYVEAVDAGDARAGDRATRFAPFAMPAVRDEGGAAEEGRARAVVETWVREALAGALAREYGARAGDAGLRFVLDVVFPSATDAYTVAVGAAGARVVRDADEDYDAAAVVAGSQLVDVIEGRRSWGDVLLGGALRACARGYAVDARGVRRAEVSPVFVYHALGYDESVERATAWQVAQALAKG